MKILHVITSLHTGGAETLIVNLMPRFKALGHKVGVVLFNGERTALMERLERECPECRIYKLGYSYYNPCYIIKLIRIMRKYDIIHTHNSSPQFYAAIANLFCHKKLVTTEHNTNNRKRNNRILSILDKWMYPRYHKIICISNQAEVNLRKYLGENNGSANDNVNAICTINNGVDVELFHNAEPLKDFQTDKFVVVMVAGFRPQKDQDTFIKAMSLLSSDQYEAWLVGDGERRTSLQLMVDNLRLQEQVKFIGLRTDVPNILKTADVVVMSTHYEGLSLSNIEGMAAGKPFVASDVEGIYEVTQGYGLLFPHGDAKALAEIITKLHEDSIYYQQVAQRCYNRAKMFDIAKMVERYEKVYLEQEY